MRECPDDVCLGANLKNGRRDGPEPDLADGRERLPYCHRNVGEITRDSSIHSAKRFVDFGMTSGHQHLATMFRSLAFPCSTPSLYGLLSIDTQLFLHGLEYHIVVSRCLGFAQACLPCHLSIRPLLLCTLPLDDEHETFPPDMTPPNPPMEPSFVSGPEVWSISFFPTNAAIG